MSGSSPENVNGDDLRDQIRDTEVSLRPKLPGQTTDERKYLSKKVFEYVYAHFYENNCHQFLIGIQP